MQNQYTAIKEDLKDWKEWVKTYTTDTRRAYTQVINTFLPFLAIAVLMFFSYDYSWIFTLIFGIVNGLFLTRIFIIQHDCGHQSFTSSRKVNNTIGFICSLLTLIPFKYWARSHNYHHAHNAQLDFRDIGDITILTVREYDNLSFFEKIQYRVYRSFPIMFFLGPLYYIFIHSRLPLIRMKGWKKEKRALWWNNLALLSFYILLEALIGYQKLLFIQLPSIITFAVVAIWVFYIQHQHDPNYKEWKSDWDFLIAAIKGSSYYKLSKLGHWFTGNIGYHHIHHLAPRIPFYYLAQCHRAHPIFEKYVTTLNFWSSFKCAFHKLWDEKNQKMISFKTYHKMRRSFVV
ncbi:MAG: fatty acid desaturase [Flavobacteriales bacterium AspAUS03]